MGIHIAILGSESTGKSTLCQQLADHFSGDSIPEFARENPELLPSNYRLSDVLKISEGQYSLVSRSNSKLIFEDTEQMNIKIWMEEVFGYADPKILERIENNSPDFYLLCLPDIPWIPDPLRVNPDKREYLFSLYKAELIIRKIPFAIVSGDGKLRIENAVEAVGAFLSKR